MKKTAISTFLFCLLSLSIFAQVPQAFKYQAVARDAAGNLLANKTISLRVSLLENSQGGNTVYQEIHSPVTTSTYGMFAINIGQGTLASGSAQFSTVQWSASKVFIKIELDPTGSNNYVLVTTHELLSVPYALHSGNSQGGPISISDLTDVDTLGVQNQQVLKYNSSTGNWEPANDNTGGGIGDNWGTQTVAIDTNTIKGDGTAGNPLSVKPSANEYRRLMTWNNGNVVWSSIGAYPLKSSHSMQNAPTVYTNFDLNNTQFMSICNGSCQMLMAVTSTIDRLIYLSPGGYPGVNEQVYELKAGITQILTVELINGSFEYKSNNSNKLSFVFLFFVN